MASDSQLEHGPDSSWGLAIGDEVVPHCTVTASLGGGERYEVFSVWDDRMLAPAVVKVVRPGMLSDESTMRGLRREVGHLSRLTHRRVVRSCHANTEGARPYLCLEEVPGVPLSLVLDEGPLSAEAVMRLGMDVSSALHYLHANDVVHLDIKPSNIITGQTTTVIDFSLARDLVEARGLTHWVGTGKYMAPEQCDPPRTRRLGAPADVWGLGVTLFHAATGVRPFRGGVEDTAAPLEQRYPQLVEDRRPWPDSVPVNLARVIDACMHRDIDERPSAADLFNELRTLSGEPPMPASELAPAPVPAAPTAPDALADERMRQQFSQALAAKRSKGGNRPGRRS